MTTGLIRTIAVNNLDWAEVEYDRSDTTLPADSSQFIIKRVINENLNFVNKGDNFSDFRERTYDMYGSLLKEIRSSHAKVLSHTRDGDTHRLVVEGLRGGNGWRS